MGHRTALQASAAVMMFAAASALRAQGPDDVLGLVGSNGMGFPAFAWTGTEWAARSMPLATDAPLLLVDSLGRTVSANLGDPFESTPWMYNLAGVEPLLDSASLGRFAPFAFIGYLVSPGTIHAPFLATGATSSTEDLVAMLPPVPTGGDVSTRLDVQTWAAEAGTGAFTYISVRREVRVAEPRSCRSDHLSGWLLPDEAEPRSVSVSEGDCSGKLESFRRPLGLFMRGGRAAIAVAPYGWEGAAGMELWELNDGQLQLIDFEPAM